MQGSGEVQCLHEVFVCRMDKPRRVTRDYGHTISELVLP